MEVKEMTAEERPREKLFSNGVKYLTDRELLSIIIGSGIKGKGVYSLSDEILKVLDSDNYSVDEKTLTSVVGIGKAKTALLSAAIEFSRRILVPDKNRISAPSDIYPVIRHYANRRQETFLSVSLNGAHEVIKIRVVSIGLVNRTLVKATLNCTFIQLHFFHWIESKRPFLLVFSFHFSDLKAVSLFSLYLESAS